MTLWEDQFFDSGDLFCSIYCSQNMLITKKLKRQNYILYCVCSKLWFSVIGWKLLEIEARINPSIFNKLHMCSAIWTMSPAHLRLTICIMLCFSFEKLNIYFFSFCPFISSTCTQLLSSLHSAELCICEEKDGF